MTLAFVETPKAAPRRTVRPRLHRVPQTGFLPRVAPTRPKSSDVASLREVAAGIGRPLYAWQDLAGEYLTAQRRGKWLYPEIVLVVGRQNGKSTILIPRIIVGLLRGEGIAHTAQDRALPRDIFVEIVDIMESRYAGYLKRKPRLANGTEQVETTTGGMYRIVAPTRSGARGRPNDLVIVDEARELTDHDFVAAAQPTLSVSSNGQTIYLSNAGTEDSVVLNALRDRAQHDPTLGYLEWSSDPERARDDRTGWHQANPSLADGVNAKGHMTFLERMYSKYTQEGTPEIFDTEHRCLWVDTELPKLVSDVAWERARQGIGTPKRPSLGLAQDPSGRRVSAALAWQTDEGVEGYVLADIDGYPVDLQAAADEIEPHIRSLGVKNIAFDPWTDRDFARHFKTAKPMQQADWEAACDRFVRTVDAGELRYLDDGRLTLDMSRTVRKETAHGWIAVRSTDTQPTTASFAFIRAVWLATMPAPPAPRVY